jgi:UDP:flavonoid glycosyltransferase YjiC (YdhE family)
MVLAGWSVDKGEVSNRGEWAGLAVNLSTQTPTPQMVKKGVDEILGNEKYRSRALELRTENENMRALDRIVTLVEELGRARTQQQ